MNHRDRIMRLQSARQSSCQGEEQFKSDQGRTGHGARALTEGVPTHIPRSMQSLYFVTHRFSVVVVAVVAAAAAAAVSADSVDSAVAAGSDSGSGLGSDLVVWCAVAVAVAVVE